MPLCEIAKQCDAQWRWASKTWHKRVRRVKELNILSIIYKRTNIEHSIFMFNIWIKYNKFCVNPTHTHRHSHRSAVFCSFSSNFKWLNLGYANRLNRWNRRKFRASSPSLSLPLSLYLGCVSRYTSDTFIIIVSSSLLVQQLMNRRLCVSFACVHRFCAARDGQIIAKQWATGERDSA